MAEAYIVDVVRTPGGRRKGALADKHPLVAGARGRAALESGDLDAGLVWAGQVQGLIHDVPTCQQLIDRIVREAEEIISHRLSGLAASSTVVS